MDLKPSQKIVLNNGVTISVRETADGGLVIDDQAFIEHLIKLGFRPRLNNSPERLAEILKNVPDKYKPDFLAGVLGK